MDAALLLRAAGALATVLGLLVAGLFLYRRYGNMAGLLPAPRKGPPRLAVVERLSLDPRRALVLVRRDCSEILLLLGPDGAVVVDGARPLEPVQ